MIVPLPDGALAARLLPLVDHPDPEVVVACVRAAELAGAPCAEVGLRHPASLEALRAAVSAASIPVGAGTVTTPADVDAALDAGARFLVSPGVTPSLTAAVTSAGAPWLPGAATPSEVMALADAGAATVKLFPVGPLGGIAAVRSVAAVADVGLVPTGGVGPRDLADLLAVDAVVAVGGTWMFADATSPDATSPDATSPDTASPDTASPDVLAARVREALALARRP